MILAMHVMSHTTEGIFWLVATVLFLIAAFVSRVGLGWLVPLGLALWTFVWAWNSLAIS